MKWKNMRKIWIKIQKLNLQIEERNKVLKDNLAIISRKSSSLYIM